MAAAVRRQRRAGLCATMGPRVQAARRRASRMLSHKIAEERAKEERAGRKKALQTTSRVLVYKGRSVRSRSQAAAMHAALRDLEDSRRDLGQVPHCVMKYIMQHRGMRAGVSREWGGGRPGARARGERRECAASCVFSLQYR